MHLSQKFKVMGVGGLPNVAFQLPNGETQVRSGRIGIDPGKRERILYWAPVVNSDNHVDYIRGVYTFYSGDVVVGELDFVWLGTDPNDGLSIINSGPSLPWHRYDEALTIWPYGTFSPLASDPDSRVFKWVSLAGTPFAAQVVMNPTRHTIDADAFECNTSVVIKTGAALGSASRQVVVAGVVSGPLQT